MPAPRRCQDARYIVMGLVPDGPPGTSGAKLLGMVRVTQNTENRSAAFGRTRLLFGAVMLAGLLLASPGCSKAVKGTGSETTGTAETTQTGSHMAGPAVEVHIPQAAVDKKPAPHNLKTPESAVRSYLAWVSYAYRIGDSQVATLTMSAEEEVRMDSYNQYNVQKGRLLDERLESIRFGTPSVGTTSTLLPAEENWTYSYISVKEGNARLAGPYTIKFESTYTVVKNKQGDWVVDSVDAKALGKVK